MADGPAVFTQKKSAQGAFQGNGASMSHVYPWDRGTNYAVELGRRVAREVLADF